MMDYDLIVVGAGAGGAPVAARASEDPRIRVLLIESGPDYPNVEALPEDLRNVNHGSFFDHDWKLRYQPSATSRTSLFARGRVTGGSSAVNTAIALRGYPADYDEWAGRGLPSWSWEKVLPYFIRLETDLDRDDPWHGKSGPVPIRRHPRDELVPFQAAFLDACAELGYPATDDHNAPDSQGAGPHPMNKRGTLRISTAIAYLAPARDRPNLTILPDTDVARVIVENGVATGVEVRARDGRTQTITARQVVLSCGAIHTPAVLVRSGIGPKSVLEKLGVAETKILEGVGRNLMDHPAIAPTVIPKAGVADWDQPVIQTTMYYTTPGGDFNDMQLEPLSFMHIKTDAPILMGLAACVFKSYSRGELRFESADVDARPQLYMNYFSDERDLVKIKDGIRRAMEILSTRAIAAVSDGIARPTANELDDADHIDAWIRRNSGTGAHPACTAMMGAADDPMAVCDDHARVRGITNLRIADASLMPVVPRVNTNIPTIMIGERVSDWVKQDLA